MRRQGDGPASHGFASGTSISYEIAAACPRCDLGRPFRPTDTRTGDVTDMLHYAVVFFVIALIAALFGFGGIAAGAAGIAKLLFVLFAILAVGSFLYGLVKKP